MLFDNYDIENIVNSTHLVPFSKNYKISKFDNYVDEYNKFLIEEAEDFEEKCISKTQLLLENTTGDVIGYFSLCSASIKMTKDEKQLHDMEDIMVSSIPALKIGKLAISEIKRNKRIWFLFNRTR